MRKRSSPEIVATILEAANGGGIGKTRLLTVANLTSSQFRKNIDLLVEKGLLAEFNRNSGHHSYRTTGLGLKYLALYNSIKAVAYIDV